MDLPKDADNEPKEDRGPRPGPMYDAALRGMVEADPGAACRVLGIPAVGPVALLPTTFPLFTLTADLLLETAPGVLAQVEYMRDVPTDLVVRMLGYRYAIMRTHPGHELVQYVVVLGSRTTTGRPRRSHRHFHLSLHMIYLRDIPPEVLLSDAGLAPLATLGRGDREERARAFARAVDIIRKEGGRRTQQLLDWAAVMATINLSRDTIDRITQEAGMTIETIVEFYRETIIGEALEQHGREQGRVEGREEGREQTLIALLHSRFGDDPAVPAVAHHLATSADLESAVRAVTSARSLSDFSV